MADSPHASLTGAELHEPKGADAASLGTVYVADGAGSGSWQSIGTSAFTGMIVDFVAPVAPAGWLECDGSTISTSTYSGLFAVMAVTSSGTRTNGSPVVTSIPSTASFRVGYYILGTGIPTGSTILSIDSATQITISLNATSSGTQPFSVSPWELGSGTIKLPDLTTAGRCRRSRTSTSKVGDLQADQNQSHTHTATFTAGVTDTAPNHTHINTLNDPGHGHTVTNNPFYTNNALGNLAGGVGAGVANIGIGSNTTGISITNAAAGTHSHTVTGTVTNTSQGASEARPLTLVVLTCVKT